MVSRVKASRYVLSFVYVSIFFSILFLVLNPIRLLLIYNILIPYIFFNFVFLFFLSILLLSKLGSVKLEYLEVTILLCLAFLLIYSFIVSQQYMLIHVLLDLLKPVFFVLSVASVRKFINLKDLCRSLFIKKLSLIMVIVTVIVVLLNRLVIDPFFSMYPSFATTESTMVSISSPLIASVYAIVLFFSGKRGVFLGFVLVMFLLFILTKKNGNRNFIINILFLVLISVITILGCYFFKDDLLAVFFKVDSSEIIPIEALSSMVKILSGGRDAEIVSSLSYINEIYQLIFGMGLGFEYLIYNFGDKSGEFHRNVHFSPISMLTLYGLIFTSIFYLYLGVYIRRSVYIIRNIRNETLFIPFVVYFLVSFVFSFTEYVFFSYSNIAISMGIIGAKYRSLKGT